MAQEHEPDLIVLDIAMPKLDGLEVIARICALGLKCKILVLTSHSPLFYSMRCMKADAAGYISKINDLDELVKAIKAVMRAKACMRPAKSSTQPFEVRTWCALQFRWTPVLAF